MNYDEIMHCVERADALVKLAKIRLQQAHASHWRLDLEAHCEAATKAMRAAEAFLYEAQQLISPPATAPACEPTCCGSEDGARSTDQTTAEAPSLSGEGGGGDSLAQAG